MAQFIFMAFVILLGASSATKKTQSPVTVTYPSWNDDANCDDEDYFKFTLKEELTQSIGGMLKNSPNVPKFKASGVVYDASRDAYWVVFDSLWSIAKLTSDLTRNDENMMIDYQYNNGDSESGFEGITRDEATDTFYLLTESAEFTDNDGDTVYHPLIHEVQYSDGSTYSPNRL